MLIFWNLPRRLRPKEGQKFSKSKKFKILGEDKKNYSKINTFCYNKQKITSLVYFFAFEGHLSHLSFWWVVVFNKPHKLEI